MNVFTIVYRVVRVLLSTALLIVAILVLRILAAVPSAAEVENAAKQKDSGVAKRLKSRVPAIASYGTVDVSGTVTVEPDLLNPLEVSSTMGPLEIRIADVAFGLAKTSNPLPVTVIEH